MNQHPRGSTISWRRWHGVDLPEGAYGARTGPAPNEIQETVAKYDDALTYAPNWQQLRDARDKGGGEARRAD